MNIRVLLSNVFLLITTILIVSCGDDEFLENALGTEEEISDLSLEFSSGDVLILSGGTVARTLTPFPLHEIHLYANDGTYKGMVFRASATEMLMGMALNRYDNGLIFSIDTVDRVASLLFDQINLVTNHILDANVTGTTLRAVATLSDGGTLVAESTTSIEKFDSTGTRVSVNFPITLTANIMKMRAISSNRFVTIFTGGNDNPVVRNNDGTLSATIASGLPCGTNCDPSDIVELPDGRFAISYQIAAAQGIELYSSTFTRIGTLFRDGTILQNISTMSVLSNGDILACSTSFNVCERLKITADTATRVGTSAFIDDASKIRQPVDSVVVP